MKKLLKIVLLSAIVFIILPEVAYGITFGEYEARLRKAEQDAANNKNALNLTQSQINQANNNIANIKQEMKNLTVEIGKLNEQVAKYHEDIKEKTEDSKNLLQYLQFSNKEDLYLDYIVNAENTTDLIYRAAVVREITEYNTKIIGELEQMIDDNKAREKQIEQREKVLEQKEKDLSKNLVTLGEQKSSLSDTAVTVEQELKNAKDLVEAYRKLGCKSNHVIGVDCAVRGEAGIFRRPTQSGYITSEFGWRGSFHRGVDIGSRNGRGEKIYPIANGRIIEVYKDWYKALVVTIEHYSAVKGQWYTSLYAHLSSYAPNVKVGNYVTSDQYIGYMGDTGMAEGVHLHMEVMPCRLILSDECSSYAKYYNYIQNQFNGGYKGPRGLITFPTGTWNAWYSR